MAAVGYESEARHVFLGSTTAGYQGMDFSSTDASRRVVLRSASIFKMKLNDFWIL